VLPLLLLPLVLTAPARPAPARPVATRAAACRPTSAQRCDVRGCQASNEGLHAEQFELDAADGTLGACLYTDCYGGKGRVVREPGAPWKVTVFGVVRSGRPPGSVPPAGSAPFPLTISVDLKTGRFTALWALEPDGFQADFGTCELRGPG
jgi:hypothetical protein